MILPTPQKKKWSGSVVNFGKTHDCYPHLKTDRGVMAEGGGNALGTI